MKGGNGEYIWVSRFNKKLSLGRSGDYALFKDGSNSGDFVKIETPSLANRWKTLEEEYSNTNNPRINNWKVFDYMESISNNMWILTYWGKTVYFDSDLEDEIKKLPAVKF